MLVDDMQVLDINAKKMNKYMNNNEEISVAKWHPKIVRNISILSWF